MKKLLNSYFSFIIFFAAFYCCAFIMVCNASRQFGYFADRLLAYKLDFRNWESAAVFFGVVFFVLLNSAMWLLAEKGEFTFWKSTRIEFLTVTVCVFLLIAWFFLTVRYGDWNLSLSIAVFPLTVYILFIIWLARLHAFLQAGDKFKRLPWYKFYVQFPIKQPISILVTLLLLGPLLYMLFIKSMGIVLLSLLTFIFTTILAEYLSIFSKSNAVQFEKVVEEKLKSERLKTEIITNVSHDIKTPLTSIINYADLISKQGIDNEVLNGYTSVIHKKSLRLKTLIEDLIEASKAGTGNIKMNLETINLCELLGQIMGEFDEQLEKNRLQLISKIPETELNIEADGRYLWRVLENIFSNTVKYSMSGTRVYVELKNTVNKYILTLKNISKAPLNISADELTEQFVRGDRARLTEGNGLGLYIAKNLTEAMGGHFTITISGDLFEVKITFGPQINSDNRDYQS